MELPYHWWLLHHEVHMPDFSTFSRLLTINARPRLRATIQVQLPHCHTSEHGIAPLLTKDIMFYAAFEQTISNDRSSSPDLYNTKLIKPFLTNNNHNNNSASISDVPYLCPYDDTQHLSLAKLSDEDAVQHWDLQDDHLHTQDEELVLDSNCRLRLGPLVPLHKDNIDICPTTATTKRGRFLVIYEQPLSDTSKPQRDQDIPVLLGPAEDEGGEIGSCIDVLKCLVDSAVYQNDRSLVWLSAWPSRADAVRYVGSIDRTLEDNVNLVRISRDYGICDSKEI